VEIVSSNLQIEKLSTENIIGPLKYLYLLNNKICVDNITLRHQFPTWMLETKAFTNHSHTGE
jgi:hypothetical protein